MANKVKYGLKNVHYAKATIAADGTATYTNPVAFPGAVNLSMDAEGEVTKFFADNIAYAAFATNAGYSGSFEAALVPDSFKKDILGFVEDTNGVLCEDAGAAVQHFALMFQFEGDVNATRHVLYNCVATRPSISGATKEDSTEAQTETLDLTASSIYVSALSKDIVKSSVENVTATATQYSGWNTAVYIPQ